MKTRLVIAAAFLAVVTPLRAATIPVTSTADNGPGTLRDALANAADGDTIDASGVSGTILQFTSKGEFLVTNSVDIVGPGPDLLTISASPNHRVLHIGSNTVVTISDLTISYGEPQSGTVGGAGIYSDHATLVVSNCAVTHNYTVNLGSGIYNDQGTLTISNCAVTGNYAFLLGGGIYNDHGKLTISACTLEGNHATNGGGVLNDGTQGTASLEIINSTVSSNSSGGEQGIGGGILNVGLGGSASVRIVGSTLKDNLATSGGGIYNNGQSGTASVEIVSSTLISSSRYSSGYGGGVYNDGRHGSASLEITNSTLSGYRSDIGGAIYNDGRSGIATVEIINSILSSNLATSFGGGVYNNGSRGFASLDIANSTVSSNFAYRFGGGIENAGTDGTTAVEIVNSTLSDNSSAGSGGGIDNYGSAIVGIANSTLSGNSATNGGAVDNEGATVRIAYSTLSGNSATNGNSIYNTSTGSLEIGSTILNAGTSDSTITNISGTVTSLGYNLSSDDGGGFLAATGDQTNTDPMLGPLQDNGGPTFTCALLPGSPAINAGDPTFTTPPDFDQRGPGFPRVVCGRIDIGAFEVQDSPVITCPPNIMIDATSPAGVVVYFTPTAVDECSPVSVSSTPSSGSVFSIGDTTVFCTATNASGNQATCSFTVHVKGAAEQINDLLVLVRGLNLKPRTTCVLTAELQSASNALRRGNTRIACGSLEAFIFDVEMQAWWGQIRPASRARLLIRDAQRIQNVLGCHDEFGHGHS